MTKIILKFEEWLIDQQHREDLIGDLAYVLSKEDTTRISTKHRADEHKNWSDVVIGISEPGYIAIFNDAWQEFLLAKQLAKDVPD